MDFIRETSLVHPKMRCWTGTKKANRDQDVILGKNGQLPPEKLLDLGKKQIFPTSALSPLTSLRKSVERACLRVGTRFMGGYAIPDTEIDAVAAELEQIQEKFDAAKEQFLADYDQNLSNWKEQNEDFKHLFDGQLPDRESVAKKFSFGYSVYKMQPCEGFEPDTDEIANQIFHELGVECASISDSLLKRKTAITGKLLREKVYPLYERLNLLSFGNSQIIKVSEEFKQLHDAIPDERLDNNHERFNQTLTFLSMCSDSDRLESIIEGQFSVMKLITPIQPVITPSITDDSVIADPQPQPAVSHAKSAGAYF